MDNCIFCRIANGEIPSNKLYEDDKVIVIMDLNPVVDGHSLVIPKKHVSDFTELDDELLTHINKVAKEIGLKLVNVLGTSALQLVVNYLDAQEVKHYHLHIIPNNRCVKATRSSQETYEMIKDSFK